MEKVYKNDSSQLTINFELKKNSQQNSQNRDQSPQLLNELKYNSPKYGKEGEDAVSQEKKNMVNIDGFIFPAYESGKFYKNNEDTILKAKIQQLEKEQLQQQKIDPVILA